MENYEKIKNVGRGAHGSVYLFRRIQGNSLVILKQIPVDGMNVDERQAALREVQVFKMLKHPNIIGYYENFIEANALCIAMEYAAGGTLADFLADRNGKVLTEEEVLWYFSQIVLSMHHLHVQQILHRDLKTNNILLSRDKRICKLSDFGISKVLTKSKATSVLGTPAYLSPEICGGSPYNDKSDMWAIGCVLYELVTLKRAFEAETLPALVLAIMQREPTTPLPDSVSPDLKQLLDHLLSKDPSKRPNAAEVMAYPVMIRPIINLMTDLGKLPLPRPLRQASSVLVHPPRLRIGSSRSFRRIRGDMTSSSLVHSTRQLNNQYRVFYWGRGTDGLISLPLSSPTMKVKQVCIGSSHKALLSAEGQVYLWEEAINHDTDELCQEIRPLKMQSPTVFSQISAGDKYMACLTDKGVLATFGTGISGCLGHANIFDISLPKIIEPLVSHSVTKISCGSRHMLALTTERKLFSWGRGDHGRLALGNTESYSTPQEVPLASDFEIHSIHCSVDASAIISKSGKMYCSGNNAYNKLGIWQSSEGSTKDMPKMALHFMASKAMSQADINLKEPLSMGTTHSALITAEHSVAVVGSNRFKQLGPNLPNDLTFSASPVTIVLPNSLRKPTAVQAGDTFTVVATDDHCIWSWGREDAKLGRTGDGETPGIVNISDDFNVREIISLCCSDGQSILAAKGRGKQVKC